MNEDLLIENSNREEVSRFKESISGYLKKWPFVLLSVIICIGIAYFILQNKPSKYKVTSKVLIDKKEQFTDPNDLLFGGGRSNSRFGKIIDETTIFSSYPIIKKTLEELKLDVTYKVEKRFREDEVYDESPLILDFDRSDKSKIPFGTKFSVSILNDEQYQLSVVKKRNEETALEGKYKFNEEVKLGDFSFNFSRNLESWNTHSDLKNAKYHIYLNSLEKSTYAYKRLLSFGEVDPQSKILVMSMVSEVPKKSIDFINTLIGNYIEQNLREKNKVAEGTVKFIDSQLAIISDSLNNKEQNLENFKSSESMSGLSVEGEMMIEQYNQIESEKAQYEVRQQYYDYLKKNLNGGSGSNIENLIAPTAFGIEDLIVNDLVKSLIELNLTKTRLENEGNTKGAFISQIDSRINEIKKTLNESIENLSNANQIILSKLNSRADKIVANAKKLPNAERQLVNLNRLLKLNENIYLFLMEKRSSAAITMSSNTPDCKIVEPAMLNPLQPISPNRKMTYMVAILLGIIIPMVIFITLDFLNDKIRDKEDIGNLTNIPIMGFIPKSKNIQDNKIVFDQPKSALAESFRTIRTNLTFFQKKKTPFVILVTSTVAKEGKTFCAINLAASLATSGKKTVLLGFDLRKPQIHNYLDIENGKGVSDYLAGNSSLQQILRSTHDPNLSILSSGPVPPNPAELISNDKTKELIEELKATFDYIILDTPPVGLVADSLLLQQESDLNLYLVRQGYSKREFINQANDLYSSKKLKNMSIVLNDVDKSSSYNYGYYEEDSRKKKGFFNFSRS